MAITVNTSLKRQAIINERMKALARILTPLKAFARAHNNVPLQGLNTIIVPYIPLETAASTDWNASNGYVAGDGTVGAKTITVNKRKYQSLGTDSATQTNQPFALTDDLLAAKLDKLCYDVLADVMSVITIANFGLLSGAITGVAATDVITSVGHGLQTGNRVDIVAITGGAGLTAADKTYAIRIDDDTFKLATSAANAAAGTAIDFTTAITAGTFSANTGYTGVASGFNVAGVASLQKIATDANWPEGQRHLVLNSSYQQYAVQDTAILNALNYGSNEAIRTGTFPEVLGFKYHGGQYVPANSENMGGFICLPSAVLFGCAPIMPTPGVMKLLAAYEQYTIPELDFVITYREFADAQKDTEQQILECTYGYAVGEAAALKRIVTS